MHAKVLYWSKKNMLELQVTFLSELLSVLSLFGMQFITNL